MDSQAEKKAKIIPEYEGEDRISGLPDELIHKIMSFLDAEEAVRTCVLSKRWKFIWNTLPFINLGGYLRSHYTPELSRYTMFIRHVLSNRNHQSSLSKLKMYVPDKLTVKPSVSKKRFRGCVMEKFIQYAISHNIQELSIHVDFFVKHKLKLSTFSSKSLKNLKLNFVLGKEFALETDCWDLPALTTLHLFVPMLDDRKLPESWLTCLPALRTLILHAWDLSETSFSFPNLTTLHLNQCTLPGSVWCLPDLLSLHLESVKLPDNMSDMFSKLVNLKHLTLISVCEFMERDLLISCPQLLNLYIRINSNFNRPSVKTNIVISAPQLCNFTSFGIFSIKVEVPKLENVNINLKDVFKLGVPRDNNKFYQKFTCMLSGLNTAKNLSFDLESIEALSEISKFLASSFSPFFNLEYVKLPKEYNQSIMSPALRSYLLGGSRKATIVTSLPQRNGILQTPVSVVAKKVVVHESDLGDCQYVNEAVCVDTVDVGVREQYVIKNSLVDADRTGQTDAVVGGTENDLVSSSKCERDFGLWQGHEVNSDFVCLLDRIMHKYPETFEHFTTKNKKLCTMNLNMLCTSLNDFSKTSMTEVNSEMIVGYRDVFTYLQNQGFDVSWLVNRLNYIEHLRFSKPLISELHAIDCRIIDAKSKLQDLQALRNAKLTEIQNAFGTTGTNLAAGSIGDDLLSGP